MQDDFPIEAGLMRDPITAPKDLLKAGIDIYYGDDRYPDPDTFIKESPDGTKTLVKYNGSDWDTIKTL
ncbi:hypothetical protein [Kiloniella laminariae]|uniref:hypothetical protein n=1 Tax=Kiloniella laminariae TaxID=454162 RepID=UPI0003A8A9F5|nr:hypothetical protein [Kiloniella laminariae]